MSTTNPTTGTTAPSTPTFGDELLTDVKKAASDATLTALKIYGGIISAAIQSIIQTPSLSELGATELSVQGNIIAAFPALEQAEIQVLGTDAQTDFSQLIAYLQTQATTLAPTS